MPRSSEKLPILVSAHHASCSFGSFSDRTALTKEQRVRFSDYGSHITAPRVGTLLRSYTSRGLVDKNRAPDDPTLFPTQDFGRPERNSIWKPGQEPTPVEKEFIFREFYQKYHDCILATVRSFTKPGVVIGWDNTAHYEIGKNEAGEQEMMHTIILSNRGEENKASSTKEQVSCDPAFLEEFAHQLAMSLRENNLPDEIRLNLVYKGGFIPKYYNTLVTPDKLDTSQPIQAFQVEYDTLLTHDQETLEPNYVNTRRLRQAFEVALYQTYVNFLNFG